MNQQEFVAVYVAVPLLVAAGWLLWRTRRLLRGFVLYALAVAALVAFVRLGQLGWRAWEGFTTAPPRMLGACIDTERPTRPQTRDSCWL